MPLTTFLLQYSLFFLYTVLKVTFGPSSAKVWLTGCRFKDTYKRKAKDYVHSFQTKNELVFDNDAKSLCNSKCFSSMFYSHLWIYLSEYIILSFSRNIILAWFLYTLNLCWSLQDSGECYSLCDWYTKEIPKNQKFFLQRVSQTFFFITTKDCFHVSYFVT